MNGKQYLKNQLPVMLVNMSGLLLLMMFLPACGMGFQSVLLIAFVWLSVLGIYLTVTFFSRKKYLDKLQQMSERLEEKYLLAEVMEKPMRADDEVFYRLMKAAEKSMLEKIGKIERERKEYKEYIEQWVHEAKTPVTAMRLLCENNRSEFTRELFMELFIELEKINRYTEQALYYARSEHTEKDYSVREIALEEVIHGAVADNRYLLRLNQVKIVLEETETIVYTDEKWIRFILDQFIANAVKYRSGHPAIRFYADNRGGQVLLYVEDNGIGIPPGDLPRIFEKGFTGENGRLVPGATGIGLYLCQKLCDRLGIGLEVRSGKTGTIFVLIFQINYFTAEMQGR